MKLRHYFFISFVLVIQMMQQHVLASHQPASNELVPMTVISIPDHCVTVVNKKDSAMIKKSILYTIGLNHKEYPHVMENILTIIVDDNKRPSDIIQNLVAMTVDHVLGNLKQECHIIKKDIFNSMQQDSYKEGIKQGKLLERQALKQKLQQIKDFCYQQGFKIGRLVGRQQQTILNDQEQRNGDAHPDDKDIEVITQRYPRSLFIDYVAITSENNNPFSKDFTKKYPVASPLNYVYDEHGALCLWQLKKN